MAHPSAAAQPVRMPRDVQLVRSNVRNVPLREAAGDPGRLTDAG
jgi:hypothetical protein